MSRQAMFAGLVFDEFGVRSLCPECLVGLGVRTGGGSEGVVFDVDDSVLSLGTGLVVAVGTGFLRPVVTFLKWSATSFDACCLSTFFGGSTVLVWPVLAAVSVVS